MLPLSCTPIPSPLPYNTGPPVDAWIWFGSPLSTDWPRETSVWHTGFQDWAPGPKVHRPLGGRTCRIAGPATRHSRCMYQARQMALLSRILSLHWSFRPLKFFHFGDTSFPLKGKMRRGHSVVSLTIKCATLPSQASKFWSNPCKPQARLNRIYSHFHYPILSTFAYLQIFPQLKAKNLWSLPYMCIKSPCCTP